MKIDTKRNRIIAATCTVLLSIAAMVWSIASAADDAMGNATQSVSVACCPRCSSNTTATIASLSVTVTQLTERVRALEAQTQKVDLVLKLFEEQINRPVFVDWLEGGAGSNGVPNKPAQATGKPAPSR